MKNTLRHLFLILLVFISAGSYAQTLPSVKDGGLVSNPWTNAQLIKPDVLARSIAKGEKIRIYNIGIVQDIKGAVNMGASSEKENLKRLEKVLKGLPSNTELVVYCGCCPMERCPNIRPAFKLLNDLKFSKAKLLDLPVNVKTDWIDKGYPMPEKSK